MKRLAIAFAALVVVGCSDEGPVSGPGTMTATVAGPNGPEGAAVVIILDEAVEAVSPVGDTEVYSRVGGSATHVVLINQNGGELSFEMAVADTTQPPVALVQEVAGPDDELRLDVTDYVVEFRR